MTPTPKKKKQSRPTPLPSRSLTGRFRTHAPQQCALSRRSRVTQVASEYPAMLCRSSLASGGSFASARPLGTVRTLYPDVSGVSRGSLRLAQFIPEPTPLTSDAIDPLEPTGASESACPTTSIATPRNSEVKPARRGVAGWIVYDLGNTLFSQNM